MGLTNKRKRHSFGDDRAYLSETTQVRVRFQEVDSMRIVWHGHYLSYFEDARRALGRRYGLDYPVFLQNNIGAPLVSLWVDYLSPALTNDMLEVEARLYKSEGAQLEFCYQVKRAGTGLLLATGGSIQAFTTLQGELLLTWPALMIERYEAWKDLWVLPP
ncbi:MAG: acyl-CoA thioesterase [bacterium]